jgi:hypothetical protein
MRRTRRNGLICGLLSLYLAGTALIGLRPGGAAAADFADPAFRGVWERTDKLVADGTIKRTFFWGPTPARYGARNLPTLRAALARCSISTRAGWR